MKLHFNKKHEFKMNRFPPHSCGGLIEAPERERLRRRQASFPPHSCGGLIEALRLLGCVK